MRSERVRSQIERSPMTNPTSSMRVLCSSLSSRCKSGSPEIPTFVGTTMKGSSGDDEKAHARASRIERSPMTHPTPSMRVLCSSSSSRCKSGSLKIPIVITRQRETNACSRNHVSGDPIAIGRVTSHEQRVARRHDITTETQPTDRATNVFIAMRRR